MGGDFKGTEGKFQKVSLQDGTIAVDGFTVHQSGQPQKIPRHYPSNVLVQLELKDGAERSSIKK